MSVELVVWENFTAGDGHPGLRTREATVPEGIEWLREQGAVDWEGLFCLTHLAEAPYDVDCDYADGGHSCVVRRVVLATGLTRVVRIEGEKHEREVFELRPCQAEP